MKSKLTTITYELITFKTNFNDIKDQFDGIN